MQLEPQEGMWDLGGYFARQDISIIVNSKAQLCGDLVKCGQGKYLNFTEYIWGLKFELVIEHKLSFNLRKIDIIPCMNFIQGS